MLIPDFFTALIIAVLILIPFILLGKVRVWEGWFWFALLLLLFTWAGGAWVGPYGPVIWGYHWLPFLFFALVFALLIAAMAPSRPPGSNREAVEKVRAERTAETVTAVSLGIFFWLLLALLIVALIFRYAWG